ncbi:MAG TPA: PilX N-terminal domain-containing pilus assembly protein [Thermoanaerobaculia bacterium]|nr:PilX N-terminal domain-containing pilus assembly protein [Thermoanaerobaculia bacterium]
MSHRRSPVSAGRGESGSAYIIVLLVLVVIAIFGIALSLITQTEMQIGSNERTLSRVFYAADAGIELAVARAVVTAAHDPITFTYTDSGANLVSGTLGLGTQVEVTAFHPIQVSACNLCEINNVGTYQDKAFYKVNHAVTVRATRFASLTAGTARTPLAQKTVSAMVEIQPFRPSVDSLASTTDPVQLAKIKF